eukprot:6029339-Prorocentrum_lima.AAC.1
MTKNIRKDVDFVNGMKATVDTYEHCTRSLRVTTTTGQKVAIWPWCDADHGYHVYYPVRAGYA